MKPGARFAFRLYVAGSAPNSTEAISNLGELCRQHLPNRHHIEIIDVFREPTRALEDGILMTPTLVRLRPLPEVRIVGGLTDIAAVLSAIGLGARHT
ncbi:MAG: circadian clock KaiB family protein [Usitatibacter sp.]